MVPLRFVSSRTVPHVLSLQACENKRLIAQYRITKQDIFNIHKRNDQEILLFLLHLNIKKTMLFSE